MHEQGNDEHRHDLPPEELRAGIASLEERLRERFGDGHPLLAAHAYRGSLWWQAACWALDEREAAR